MALPSSLRSECEERYATEPATVRLEREAGEGRVRGTTTTMPRALPPLLLAPLPLPLKSVFGSSGGKGRRFVVAVACCLSSWRWYPPVVGGEEGRVVA